MCYARSKTLILEVRSKAGIRAEAPEFLKSLRGIART